MAYGIWHLAMGNRHSHRSIDSRFPGQVWIQHLLAHVHKAPWAQILRLWAQDFAFQLGVDLWLHFISAASEVWICPCLQRPFMFFGGDIEGRFVSSVSDELNYWMRWVGQSLIVVSDFSSSSIPPPTGKNLKNIDKSSCLPEILLVLCHCH